MNMLLQENWIWLIAALLIGIAVAWYIFSASRKTTIERDDSAENEGDTRTKRNQALIDAPPVAAVADTPAAPPMAKPTAEPAPQQAPQADPEQMPKPAPDPAPQPAPASAPIAAATVTSTTDDLTMIKGVGPKLAVLLRELGVTAVCEGVETAGELQMLTDLGVDLIQGYLIARPTFEGLSPIPAALAA